MRFDTNKCRTSVLALFQSIKEHNVEDEVVDYVSSLFASIDDDSEIEDIIDTLRGLSDKFAAMSEEDQFQLISQLIASLASHERSHGDIESTTSVHVQKEMATNLCASEFSKCTEQAVPGAQEWENISSNFPVDVLLEISPPGVGREFLRHYLVDVHKGDLDRAAAAVLEEDIRDLEKDWLAAQQLERERKAAEQKEQARINKQLLNRFQYEPVPPAKTGAKAPKRGGDLRMWEPQEVSGRGQVRYHNGAIVSRRGEKYVVENLKEEWDGGSSGKVYTKGKRGKGYV